MKGETVVASTVAAGVVDGGRAAYAGCCCWTPGDGDGAANNSEPYDEVDGGKARAGAELIRIWVENQKPIEVIDRKLNPIK